MYKCKNSCPTGKHDDCCFECDLKESCEGVCDLIPSECGDSIMEETSAEAGLAVFQAKHTAIINSIADIVTQKKSLEEQEKVMKEQLKAAMEQYGIKAFDNEVIKVTYIASTTATTVDSKKLKEKYPDIAAECSKSSNKSAYVKIEVK